VCDVTLGLLLALAPGLPLYLTSGLPLGPQPCDPFALVASPKLGLRHLRIIIIIIDELQNTNFIENLSMKFYPYKTTTIKNNLRHQSFPIF